MTGIEDLLRGELRREASRARPELLSPLHEPAESTFSPSSETGRWRRLTVAAASAAAALVLVVAGITFAGRIARTPEPPRMTAAQGARPPFYVIMATRDRAVVRDSKTGRIVSRVKLPAKGWADPLITAAPNGLSYVLCLRGRFFWLRLAPDGRSARIRALLIPPLSRTQFAESIALTPDGRHLAMAIQLPSTPGGERTSRARGKVTVASITTGAERSWWPGNPGLSWQVSWASDRTLAIAWESKARDPEVNAREQGLWLLDTRAPGTGLFSGRRVPSSLDPSSAVILPGGHAADFAFDGITQVTVATGASREVFSWAHGNIEPCGIFSVAPAGSHLLMTCGKFGRLDNGIFTPLPGVPSDTNVPAAW